MKFSHLHNHTQFSLLDGATNIPKMFKKAAQDEMPAVALTDHGNMFGAFRFVAEAWKNTKVVGKDEHGNDIKEPVVKPIVGCEFYLVENRHKQSFTREEGRDIRHHQLLLAKDEEGYRNLIKLCSLGFTEGLYGKFPRIDKELVLQYHKGLIATTCCIGAEIPQAILKESEAKAEELFKWWLDLFGEDFYVEIQRHGMEEQERVNHVLLKFAEKYKVPIIASNDSHYLDREDYNAHDILLCLNTGEKQSTPIRKDYEDNSPAAKSQRFGFFNDQFYFKSTQEMINVYQDIPQAIENTQDIVDKIKPLQLKKDILLPHFKVPQEFNDDEDAFLKHLTYEGARKRYNEITPEVQERLDFELFTIRTMGFAGYFLIVADFIQAGKDLGVLVGPGRGSAAGSAVAYCIGITNIDPIKYNLLFERFLNPDRNSMPDIDTDFDDVGRQKVIDYVVDKYGQNQVAHIVTYGTMAAKSSIKDVARVMDLPLAQSNDLAKLVPEKPGINLGRLLNAPFTPNKSGVVSLKEKENLKDEEIQGVNQLRSLRADESTITGKVLKEAEHLEGSIRNTGIHAAGIIIAPSDLSELIPVFKVKDINLLITQFDGSIIEDAGVIKMDFLGLKTLTILKDALLLIERNHNVKIILDDLPLDDAKTYELYQKGDTNGTFQFESAGMQKHLRDLKPDQFADLIAMNALYRPGPIAYIPNFIARKHGSEEIHYDLPEMEEYLEETYGITVYQEQVMLLSQKLGGFSKGDADVLRKAMGNKQASVLAEMKVQFIEGATAKGHPEKELEKIWTDWEKFAQYAFNKSHSTCYAFVAYQTAYLKAHYPSEYMAAVLNNQGALDKITFFMEECGRMGIEVLGPDINESLKGFAVNKKGVIRFGLGALKGVGEAAVDEIVSEREENGLFKDMFDLITRVNQRTVNRRSLESLALGGAFDCFEDVHRALLVEASTDDGLTGIERIVKYGNNFVAAKTVTENSLFGEEQMPDIPMPTMYPIEPWPLHVGLEKEREVLGMYLSGHPLDQFKFEMKHFNIIPINHLEHYKEVSGVRIAGIITDGFQGVSRAGKSFTKLTISDYNGKLDIFLNGEDHLNYGMYAERQQKVMLVGTYRPRFRGSDQLEFKIQQAMLLEDVKTRLTDKLKIQLDVRKLNEASFKTFIENLDRYEGTTTLSINLIDSEKDIEVDLVGDFTKVLLNDEFLAFLTEQEIKYIIEAK